MKCDHGFERCGICHAKDGSPWPQTESSARPASSKAPTDEEFEKDGDGNYKFMVTYQAFNNFLAGCKSEAGEDV